MKMVPACIVIIYDFKLYIMLDITNVDLWYVFIQNLMDKLLGPAWPQILQLWLSRQLLKLKSYTIILE